MREYITKKIIGGVVFAIAVFGTTILAVAMSGTIATWTTGQVLKSSDLNITIASLKTAIEGITSSQWTTNGANIGYTAGSVGIGTTSPTEIFHVKSSGNVLPMWETTNSTSPVYHRFVGSDGLTKGYVGMESSTGTGLIGAGSYAL